MRILVVGSGAREHALVYKLAQDHDVICAPGNPGIALDGEIVSIAASEHAELIELARKRSIDLVVIGPEDPLIAGLADRFESEGFATYGPSGAAAQLEGSKAFSKSMMAEAGIPTASFELFSDWKLAGEYAKKAYGEGLSLAVKASGNALGRGVAVCESLEDALDAIEGAMVRKEFGRAGETVVLERLMRGREFSLLTLVGEQNYVSLPIAQDYKRAHDGDTGPNTGGLGSYSPCPWALDSLVSEVEDRMVRPILAKLREVGAPFRGTLFTGVMVTENGPQCLEYNVRFGDPETQSIMMRLDGDFGQSLLESATGAKIGPLSVLDRAAVTVVVASSGYPGAYLKGAPISLGPISSESKLFYAGVAERGGALVSSGGRVFSACGTGATIEEARQAAYAAAGAVSFEGCYVRSDIALPTGLSA
jgi:phosphoribosylamine--glycine ligase